MSERERDFGFNREWIGTGTQTKQWVSKSTPSINPAQLPRQVLVDTFNLPRNYLDHKIVDWKSDPLSEQDSLSKKFRDESSIKFRSEGNRIQFKFNEEIQSGAQKICKQLATTNTASSSLALNKISKLKDRNNLTRIADTSAGAGIPSESTNLVTSQIMKRITKRNAWRKAELSNQLRRKPKLDLRRIPDQPAEQSLLMVLLIHAIYPPFIQALHDVSRAHGIYVTYADRQDTGDATVHLNLNKDSKPMVRPALQQSSESSNVLDKYSFNTIVDDTKSQNDVEFQCFLAPIHYLEKLEVECSP